MKRAPLLVIVWLAGCATSSSHIAEAPSGEPRSPRETEAFVTRGELGDLLDAGLGRFLQRIDTEAVLVDGEFRGFRLTRLDLAGPNAGLVDLRVGDVVHSVNGRSIDRPEHALAAWESLRDADAIVVNLTRDGTRRELRVPIVDAR